MEKGGQSYYYHYDGLGSVTNLTDSTGSTAESYSYDAFGTPSATSAIGNRYMFTGREYDAETGLYYYRERHYSPYIGRFLQRDPLNYDDENTYTYCYNDPVNWVDPYGLMSLIPRILVDGPVIVTGGGGIIVIPPTTSGGTIVTPPLPPTTGGGTPYPPAPQPGENKTPNPKECKEQKGKEGQGVSEKATEGAKKEGEEKKEKKEEKKEHRKKRPSTEEKHTKKKPGRANEKKRQHEGWRQYD